MNTHPTLELTAEPVRDTPHPDDAPERTVIVDQYFATLTGARGNGLIGPVIVTVEMTTFPRKWRGRWVRIRPTFSVAHNGRHQFGWCGTEPRDREELEQVTRDRTVIRHRPA